MIKTILIAACALSLAGCAQPVWYRDNTTSAEFNADKSACEYEAMKYAGGYDSSLGAVGQGVDLGMRRAELGKACMFQKGYRQQP